MVLIVKALPMIYELLSRDDLAILYLVEHKQRLMSFMTGQMRNG